MDDKLINPRDVDPMDAAQLLDWMDTAFYALSRLRSGALRLDGTRDQDTLTTIYTGINDLLHRLQPRLDGITAALVRAHYDAGGSHAELARAMDVATPTAQYRGDRVRKTAPPSTWERWATGELEPVTVPAAEVRPGWTLIVADQHVQVASVAHHTHHVEITCGRVVHHYTDTDEVTTIPRAVPLATVDEIHTYDDGGVAHRTAYRRA